MHLVLVKRPVEDIITFKTAHTPAIALTLLELALVRLKNLLAFIYSLLPFFFRLFRSHVDLLQDVFEVG